MSSLEQRIKFLRNIDNKLELAKISLDGKPGAWIPIEQINESINNYYFRSQISNELIIELDKTTYEKNLEFYEKAIKPKLLEKDYSFDAWTTHSKSIHIHIFFDKDLTPNKRYSWLCELLGEDNLEKALEIGAIDDSFLKKERQLIALEYQEHYKSKKTKDKIDENKSENLNVFGLKEPIKKRLSATKRKVDTQYWDILKNPKSNEQERVSCVMQIHNQHKEWTKEDVFGYINKHNEWNDFNPKTTSEKLDYVWKYTLKENPLPKPETTEATEVPSLSLVNFSQYDQIFENTHNHLPAYNLVKNELGLIGKEYYAPTKALNYYLESLRQPSIQYTVGSEPFDNRIHLLLIGGAGTGKNKYKSTIRKYSNTVECSGARTNLEQLIGKKRIVKGQEEEIKGYFGYKGLIVDESQNLVCESDHLQSSIMREIRIAMDIFGENKSEKKLVDTQLLSYPPETRFVLLTHDILFPPIFFDTGTFRRFFCFHLKPSMIKQEDTIKNLFKESHEQELREYLNTPSYNILDLSFSQEAIKEIIDWFLTWNKFIFLNPNQRVRGVSRGLVYSAKVYFFRLSSILSISRGEKVVSEEVARIACFDTIHFLLKTIELYANKSNPTLSRDVWKSDCMEECMFFEWLHYNGAVSKEKSCISIKQAQTQIEDFFGVMERQARSIYNRFKKQGYVQDYKGVHESLVWLGFEPEIDCLIDFGEEKFPDFKNWLLDKKQKIQSGESGNVQGGSLGKKEGQSGESGRLDPPLSRTYNPTTSSFFNNIERPLQTATLTTLKQADIILVDGNINRGLCAFCGEHKGLVGYSNLSKDDKEWLCEECYGELEE